MSLYSRRGVSAQKEEVHDATKKLDKGLFPRSFCKLYPDYLAGDAEWVNVMHADGAGTKSILAYLYWKETGDVSVWKGIAQDAIVMNLDDLICTGIYDNILFSSTIDRNKNRIPGEVLKVIIEATQEFFDVMKNYGIRIQFMGGETADVGDLVRTITVNGTMTARWPQNRVISNEKIKAGNMIVGLAGFGQSNYETEYNSGIGSNGLTSARHDVLNKIYGEFFSETFDDTLETEVVYIGDYRLRDDIDLDNGEKMHAGKLLLSPTRTFAPVVKAMLEAHFDRICGMVHCSGGGQTKCLHYVPDNVRVIKDKLFNPPEIFRIIQESSGAEDKEMYQVFNMGTRLEIYTEENHVDALINIASRFGVPAQVIGRVEDSESKQLVIKAAGEEILF